MPAVASAAAFTQAPKRAFRAQIPKAVPTPRMPRSAIPTATVGCSRRSRRGFPAASEVDATTSHGSCNSAELLRETAEPHGHYEKTHAEHHWRDWYAGCAGAHAEPIDFASKLNAPIMHALRRIDELCC